MMVIREVIRGGDSYFDYRFTNTIHQSRDTISTPYYIPCRTTWRRKGIEGLISKIAARKNPEGEACFYLILPYE